jgi:hypothetical protein
MKDSNQPAELMFKQARDAVRRMTSDRQTPWESSSLTGQNFYFAAAGKSEVARSPTVTQKASEPVLTARVEDSNRPDFMADVLCQHAVGEWRIKSDVMNGSVELKADAAASAKVRDKSGSVAGKWDCDAANRRFVVKYAGNVTHSVTMDGSENLMFGYDQGGVPVIYTR